MKIWVDADACPKLVKEAIFKTSLRQQIAVCLVANSNMAIPNNALVSLIQVEKGDDVADQYIVDNVALGDLVVTADIPLAAQVVEKSVAVINPRGDIYSEENICEILSMRDFLQNLRETGATTDGPAPFSSKDKARFASAFNNLVMQLLKP